MRAAAAWLGSPHRRCHACKEGTSIEDILERLRNIFLEADLDDLDTLRDHEGTWLAASAFACAARVAEEYRLGLWVREQNLAGTPVRTPVLIDAFQKNIESKPPPVQLRSVPQEANSTGRNWVFKWRRSQGSVFGKLGTPEPVTPAESRQKVSG